jgi:tetratricopeptide (TPR) repeat protein
VLNCRRKGKRVNSGDTVKRSSFALFVALLTLTARTPAEPAPVGAAFHPDLLEAEAFFARSDGAAAYLALRRIWQVWDRSNPEHVEEALRGAAARRGLPAPTRAYAELLGGFARFRRGDVGGATARVQKLGFVAEWLMVGPFDNEGKSGLKTPFQPEQEFAEPVVPGRAYSGKERTVRWRPVSNTFPLGWVDASLLVRPERNVCLYLKTFVSEAELRAPRTISAWVGVQGAFVLFFNGQEVLRDEAYRGYDADRMGVSLRLLPGLNDITLKLCNAEAPPIASLRLGDARGAPDAELAAKATVELGAAAAKAIAELAKGYESKVAPAVEGPLQAFERQSQAAKASPELMAYYAEYLLVTGSDDPVEHRARDLAGRAAERDPNVERLLLAASLAEDRNGAAEWLGRAEKLAKSPRERRRVLVARALHVRRGPSWREASRLFEAALELDPNDIVAIEGQVELYNRAGLARTALGVLERGIDRNPHSVHLLNLHASQLRALGRASEATAAESRYSALRFDDPGLILRHTDLAIARHNRASAERWVDRLLGVASDKLWALGVAAKTYRAFGQNDRALAAYDAALELCPEDVGTLHALSDLHGELGHRDRQLALLQQILRLRPQERDVREYVEHIAPARARPDEAYAWSSERFLPLRHAPAKGENRRVLRDLTVSTVFENGLSNTFRQIVFQPLTDSGAAISRQHVFSYQADRQQVQLRGAKVYRADGRIDQAIESGEAAADDPSISMYTSARNFYVQFPRLEAGDVVELRYRIDDITPRNEFADYFGDVVYLQSLEPVLNAEYVLLTPKQRRLFVDEHVPGLERSVEQRGDQRIYRFFAPSVAAVNPEPGMPPLPEVLGFVHVSTYKSWDDLGRWYWGLVHEQFDLDDETRKLARKIADGAESTLEKVRRVYDWVIDNTRYVALEFGIYGYKPRRCVQTVARGWGDCKDKATVIITLLEELGVDAELVIVRTQMRGGFPSKLPSLAPFDHAIAYVPELDLYLDGTAEYTGIKELPRMDRQSMALRVTANGTKLVTLPGTNPDENVITRDVVAELSPDGSANVGLEYTVRGVDAPEWRKRYHAEGTRRERLLQDLGSELPGFALAPAAQGVQTSKLEDFSVPVELVLHGRAPRYARVDGKRLTLDATVGLRLTPQFASLSGRRHDLRILSLSSREENVTLRLPNGMKAVTLPDPVKRRSPFGSYEIAVEQAPGKVTVKSRLALSVSRVEPEDYEAFREFCSQADAAMSQQVVIEK